MHASILSFLTLIDNTALNRQTNCVWWHLVLRGLMLFHQGSRHELSFSNCEHTLEMYLLFLHVFVLRIFIVIKVLSSLIGWLSVWFFLWFASCFFWFFFLWLLAVGGLGTTKLVKPHHMSHVPVPSQELWSRFCLWV